MQEVVLVIHLILAVSIIILVLLQRSEGGGLGIGGSGGLGNFASARGAASALTRVTTLMAIGFFATSLTLGVLANMEVSSSGLLDQLDDQSSAVEEVKVEDVAAPISEVTDKITDVSSEVELEIEEIVEEVKEDILEEAPVAAPVSE